MNIGYARVSTKDQNPDRQIDALVAAGVDERHIFLDKVSGADKNRPALDKMLDYVREGDTLFVMSFDRLARSTSHLLKLSEQLNSKGVNLVSLKEQLDTSTAQGRFFFTVSAAFAEFERELIKERQREGIQAARERGTKLGRKPMDSSKLESAMDLYKTGRYTIKESCAAVGISEAVFYRYKRTIDKEQPND